MILGIERELSVLLQAVITGNILYLMYKMLSIFQRLIRHKRGWIAMEDLAYWLFASVYVFLQMQKYCNGNIRWYFVLGLLGGGLATRNFVGKIVRKYIDKSEKTE